MPKDLREIDYKSELYLSHLAASKRYKEACQKLQRKRRELPHRESDPAEMLEWTLAKQDVSLTLKEKNKTFDLYNASIRSQLSIEQLGLERFEAIKEAVMTQNKIEALRAEPETPELYKKVMNAWDRASQGVKPEDLAPPKPPDEYVYQSVDLGPPPTEEEQAIAAKEREENLNYLKLLEDFNKANPSKEPPAHTPVWKGPKSK